MFLQLPKIFLPQYIERYLADINNQEEKIMYISRGIPTMWPSLSQIKPDPVPSTLPLALSLSMISSDELFGILANSISLIKTTDGEVSCSKSKT